jgi:hypothetical protein
MVEREELLAQSRAYRRTAQARAESLLRIDQELVTPSFAPLAASRDRLSRLERRAGRTPAGLKSI